MEKLHERKQKLLDNPTMSAAVALDPRFCKELNTQQKDTAIKVLQSVHTLLQNIQATDSNSIEPEESDDEDITVMNTTNLSKYCQGNVLTNCTMSVDRNLKVQQLIEKFCAENHSLTNGTILDLWNEKKMNIPNCMKLQLLFWVFHQHR